VLRLNKDFTIQGKTSFLRGVLGFAFVLNTTALKFPVIEIVFRTLQTLPSSIVLYLTALTLCFITILCFLVSQTILRKVFNIQVPSRTIPQAAPQSKIAMFKLVIYSAVSAGHSFEFEGRYLTYYLGGLLALSILNYGAESFFLNTFNQKIANIQKAVSSIVLAIAYTAFACQLLPEIVGFDVYIIPILAFPLFWSSRALERYRREQLLSRILNAEFSIEMELQQALYEVFMMVERAIEKGEMDDAFGIFMQILHKHTSKCSDMDCFCLNAIEFYQIIQDASASQEQLISLSKAQYDKFKPLFKGRKEVISTLDDFMLGK